MGHLKKSDYEIRLTVGIREAILNYFSRAHVAKKHYAEYSSCHREVDFLRMRRFLHTTYKTLNEIDPNFMAKKVSFLHDSVEKMATIYDEFLAKSKSSLHSYEVVFLQAQADYVKYESMLTHNADELSSLRNQADQFKSAIEELKEKIKSMPKQIADYEKREAELKRLKRLENSTIVRLAFLIEENAILSEVLKSFKETYEEQFLLMFDQYTKDLQPELLSILNAMAFEFDIELWLKANDSDLIQNHFKNSYAGDVISSKTYLSYYLKGLDPEKFNSEQKDLKVLLDYLNRTSTIHCVLYMPSPKDLHHFETALEADNSGFAIHAFSDAKVALGQAFKTRINILILDLETPANILENFLSLYRKNSKHLTHKAKIILISSEVNEKSIAQANMLGADSLIEREIESVQIIETVYDLLKIDTIADSKGLYCRKG